MERPPDVLEATSPREPASSSAPSARSAADEPSSDAWDPDAVGPAASYGDASGDAHGGAQVEPVSQSSFDILHVAWDPLPREQHGRRGYSTSITIAGPAREDAAYASYGHFADGSGEQCQLYNILELGTRAYTHAFCGSIGDGTRRFLGRTEGRPVTSSQTAAGETTIIGLFDEPAVHHELEAGNGTLYQLSAFTAMCSPSPGECDTYAQEWDWVSSTLRFRV